MPRRPKSACKHPGCPNLTPAGQSYCDEHKKIKRKMDDDRRGPAHLRGYDKRWEKVRNNYIKRYPLCERCEASGKITPAFLVHHIKPLSEGGDRLNYDNLQALCERCHGEVHAELQSDKRDKNDKG